MMPNSTSSIPATAPGPLVMALGDFGQSVCEILSRSHDYDPTRAIPPTMWAGPAGWSELPDLVHLDEPVLLWLPVSDWLEKHQAGGEAILRKRLSMNRSQGRSVRQPSIPETGPAVVCVVDLQETFGRQLLLPVLRMIERETLPIGSVSITVIAAVNSFQLTELSDEDAFNLRETLETLLQRFDQQGTHPTAPVDWFYLIDAINEHSQPLKPIYPENNPPTCPETIRSHVAAEFIQALADGLMNSPAYQNTRRQILQVAAPMPPSGWVGTLAAGRLVFPAIEQNPPPADKLASMILNDWIIGTDRPSDIPQVKEFNQSWMEDCRLEHVILYQTLTRDEDGQRLVYTTRPPDLRKIRSGDLVAYLQYWDSVLEKRWQDDHSFRAVIQAHARQQTSNASAWLDLRIKALIQHQPGGVRQALMFLSKAAKTLESESQTTTPEKPFPTRLPAWVTGVFKQASRKIFGLPDANDLNDCYTTLAQAISVRLGFQALLNQIWQMGWKTAPRRAGFALAAILLVGLIVGPAVLAASLPLLGILLLLLISARWGRWMTRNMFAFLRNEIRLHDALEKTVLAIREKYQRRIEQAISEETGRVYAKMAEQLRDWQGRVAQRKTTLEQASAILQSSPEGASGSQALWMECRISGSETRSGWDNEFSPNQVKDLAAQFLQSSPPGNEREQSAPELAAGLRSFCSRALSERAQPLAFQLRLERAAQRHFQPAPGSEPAVTWLRWLFDQLNPAFPYAANGVAIAQIRPLIHPAGPLRYNLAGIPSGTLPRKPPGKSGEPVIDWFECGPVDHLIGVKVIQGIVLEEQPYWKYLTERAQERSRG